MKAIAITLMIIIAGCGPKYHLNRSAYHLRMAEAKGAKVTADTVYEELTVITEGEVHDTVVVRETLTDTLVIDHVEYLVKLKYDTVNKTEYVFVECKPDTVYVQTKTAINNTVEEDSGGWQLPLIIGAFVLLGIAYLLRK